MGEQSVKKIEEQISEYVRESSESGDEFTTGWILVAAIASSSLDNVGHNGYITITSDGLPHHAQLGLLAVAQQDKQAGATVSGMYRITEMLSEDWDEEED
jgi:hypothetical protein